MRQGLSESRTANLAAHAIHRSFDDYHAQFVAITRRAPRRFEHRDWQGMRADAAERLELYAQVVTPTVDEIRRLLGQRVQSRITWAGMKAVYSGLIAERDDWEIAETFFNSITRRIFSTVGVDHAIEFVDTDFDIPPTPPSRPVFRAYDRPSLLPSLMRRILDDYRHAADYADMGEDARRMAIEVERHLMPGAGLDRLELLRPIFYRNKGAYIIGRLWSGSRLIPLAVALLHPPEGITVDAVLLDEDDLSKVFSFAHSYFEVEADRPHEVVAFLRSIMPRKRVAELYISLGHHKHGKTELFRDLLGCLEASPETRFEVAPGEPGMIMEVFTLPGYDLVLKVIKDTFAEPKQTTRQAVMRKYHLVFRHDRAGRLVDAQEFEHLEFGCQRFAPRLLDRLLEVTSGTVCVADGRVIIKHAYIERRVVPLDLYVRQADIDAARTAVIDYGNAIKDLAASNIFPGDFWLKNFGVTRHGRVVFYDYDELCLLTECRFKRLPEPQDEFEALAGEPWFAVHADEVFPEEFGRYLRMPRGLDRDFLTRHADLFTVEFWEATQARLRAGEVIDIFAYPQHRRLRS